jgi:hypothetical protein
MTDRSPDDPDGPGDPGDPGDTAMVPPAEARAALGGPAASAARFGHSTLGPTRGVWRVLGSEEARVESAILKVVGPRDDERADASRRPDSYQFWAREPAVLADGLPPAYLEAGLRGPRLVGRFERPDGAIALWLEDVPGRTGADLSVADLAAFARRLGAAQGRIAADAAPVPTWASRGFLRDYAAGRPVEPGSPWRLEPDDPRWDRPSMAAIDAGLRADLVRLQRERETFLGWVGAAPRTIAHLDVWPNNIVLTADGGVVLLDWAFAGDGGLGEDAGNLVPDSVWDLIHPPAVLAALDRAVHDGYLGGLREGGWDGDEREVRLAMCASAVKYDWIAAGMLARSGEAEQRVYGAARPVETGRLFDVRAEVLRFLSGWADEARRLAAELGRS